MNRTLPILGAGAILGILATLAFVNLRQPEAGAAGDVVRDITDVPQMSAAVAEQHREQRYASLTTIEQVVALPTEFARLEALHVLAGRSDSARVQALIFAANRIADDIEREAFIEVLFFRLTDLDPQSALALARTEDFNSVRAFESAVWQAWGRKDLDDALFAARTQSSAERRAAAAQSLYAAFGYMGNEITDRIESELEIAPDNSTQARYLYRLADRSVADAIAFINQYEPGRERGLFVPWLAVYLAARDPNEALQYARLFEVPAEGNRFRAIVRGEIALQDPAAAIEQMLAGGDGLDGRSWGDYVTPAEELARRDLESAKRFFAQARSERHRQILGMAIVSAMLEKDPAAALAWARENDSDQTRILERTALNEITRIDPQLAFAEVMALAKTPTGAETLYGMINQIARHDPATAVSYLEQIEDKQQRLQASMALADVWLLSDSDAAIDWILSHEDATSGQIMMRASQMLVSRDIDKAIRLLPRLNEELQPEMRLRIARQLGMTRSAEEAQAFIQEYQGQPGYDRLQENLVAGLAQSDPVEAMSLAGNISDAAARTRTTGRVGAAWYDRDPAAATQWVSSLPRGSARDEAIMRMASRWGEATAEQQALIASIEDREKRGETKAMQVISVFRADPTRARELLKDEDILSEQRKRIEHLIDQGALR